jgi:hypothetical protein
MNLSLKYIIATIALLFLAKAFAHETDGIWVFDKAVDHDGLVNHPAPPPANRIEIKDGILTYNGDCVISLASQDYYPGGPFQSLLKEGAEEGEIGDFLTKQFNFDLKKTKKYYTSNPKSGCTSFFGSFLFSPTRLIAIRGGVLFYGFRISANSSDSASPKVAAVDIQSLNFTPLPFRITDYIEQCASQWPTRNGVPIPSTHCAPSYFPAVATKTTKDTINRLVGSHEYKKGGARNDSEDYNNPVSHNLHPLFLIFPPYKGVTLVRVDDIEKAEERDVIKGAYLAIKDGRVTDQLNVSCDFDTSYVCTDHAGTRYQLTIYGQFKKL